MKVVIAVWVGAVLLFGLALWRDEAEQTAWQGFVVAHHCRITQRPQGFWADARLTWTCDDGVQVLHP